MTKKQKILIVEDEEAIRRGLVDVFTYHGFETDFAVDGKTGLEKALAQKPDLILLDVMLPEIDGFTVCHELKTKHPGQRIILLTAKTTEEDVITGLTLGADDYVGKPFSVRELVLRAQAVLRRGTSGNADPKTFRVGDFLTVDPANLEGSYAKGGKCAFTKTELELLLCLRASPGRPLSREELLEKVWGYDRPELLETRTVDIHIAKLRRKIEPDPKNPAHLVTVRGGGYRLDGCQD
jgi:DNA-binding response OmpR family regulator